jgi:hypothetical protein
LNFFQVFSFDGNRQKRKHPFVGFAQKKTAALICAAEELCFHFAFFMLGLLSYDKRPAKQPILATDY